MTRQTVHLELRKAREHAGLSLGRLAELCGIDTAAVSRLESGRHAKPTLGTLARYATAVGKKLVVSLED
ncbi:MAG TPA: helix-turn-helix transcriptional regulator [Gemmataceae bacterium]|jgi:transcriptional regulator with XRE-family HTH domain|nr:helix-turn-helix transcriptional regulator [Gemmataceae bacterium]